MMGKLQALHFETLRPTSHNSIQQEMWILAQPELQEQDLKDTILLRLWYTWKLTLAAVLYWPAHKWHNWVNRTLYRRRNELLFPPFSMLKFSLHPEEIPPLGLISQRKKKKKRKINSPILVHLICEKSLFSHGLHLICILKLNNPFLMLHQDFSEGRPS